MTFESCGSGSRQVHLMRIDNLCLLLKIECISVLNHLSLSELIFVLFLLDRLHCFRIRVPHKLVGAPGLPTPSVATDSSIMDSKGINSLFPLGFLDTHPAISNC